MAFSLQIEIFTASKCEDELSTHIVYIHQYVQEYLNTITIVIFEYWYNQIVNKTELYQKTNKINPLLDLVHLVIHIFILLTDFKKRKIRS